LVWKFKLIVFFSCGDTISVNSQEFSIMGKIKCVLFDCDGVLVDSETLGIGVLVSMVREYGYTLELEPAVDLMRGLSFKACCSLVELAVGQTLPLDFEPRFRERSFEEFKLNMRPVPGVVPFVESLQQPLGVASSGPVSKIRLNLGLVGLLPRFEGNIFSCFEIQSWKPEPDIYLHAAKSMGFAVDECIVIEDSKPGVMAAVAGGFKTYGLAHPKTACDLQDAGAELFDGFDTLKLTLQPYL